MNGNSHMVTARSRIPANFQGSWHGTIVGTGEEISLKIFPNSIEWREHNVVFQCVGLQELEGVAHLMELPRFEHSSQPLDRFYPVYLEIHPDGKGLLAHYSDSEEKYYLDRQ
jgi:hypothetical protein